MHSNEITILPLTLFKACGYFPFSYLILHGLLDVTRFPFSFSFSLTSSLTPTYHIASIKMVDISFFIENYLKFDHNCFFATVSFFFSILCVSSLETPFSMKETKEKLNQIVHRNRSLVDWSTYCTEMWYALHFILILDVTVNTHRTDWSHPATQQTFR